MTALVLRGVTRSYPRPAADRGRRRLADAGHDVTLVIRQAESADLVGESGSGKSTPAWLPLVRT